MNKNNIGFLQKIDLQLLFLTCMGLGVFAYWQWLQGARQEGEYPVFAVPVFWLLVLLWLLWMGNHLIYRIVKRYFDWETNFNLRFILQLFLTFAYSLACINLSYYAFKTSFTEFPPDKNQFILLNIYSILFLVPVLSIQFGFLFLQKWKRAIVEQEKLKKEQIQTELVALKAHLAPHFLFNNLNILSSLIGGENYDAQDFLDRFSEVYRYVLKNRDAELILLEEELEFLQAYVFLLRQRFSNSLEVDFRVDPISRGYLIPPLVLQMVLENALKHNKLSEQQPLNVLIRSVGAETLIVENDLHPRAVPENEKSAFGLENIRRRYWLLTRQPIRIEKSDIRFSIHLPLIIQHTI